MNDLTLKYWQVAVVFALAVVVLAWTYLDLLRRRFEWKSRCGRLPPDLFWPWDQAKLFKDNPEIRQNHANAMQLAHEKRIRKATNRACNNLRSRGLLPMAVGMAALLSGCNGEADGGTVGYILFVVALYDLGAGLVSRKAIGKWEPLAAASVAASVLCFVLAIILIWYGR